MVSPLRALGLLILVGGLLVALAVLVPGGRLVFPATALTPPLTVRLIGLPDVLPTPPPALKDITGTLAQASAAGLLAEDDSVAAPGTEPAPDAVPGSANARPVPADSLTHAGTTAVVRPPAPPLPTRRVPAPDTARLAFPIEFPEGRPDVLTAFFRTLHDLAATGGHTRVLHIGDSQLEGDRVTSYLRQRFQEQFGGCGPGLVAVAEVNEARQTVQVRPRGPWKKYAAYGPRQKAPHVFYGPLDAYFRFGAARTDSSGKVSGGAATARYTFPRRGFGPVGRPEQVRVLYRNPNAPFQLTLKADGAVLADDERLDPTAPDSVGVFTKELPVGAKGVEARFRATSGNPSPDVLALAFDCRQGVAVDNVSLRGSSCTEFGRMQMPFYGRQLRRLGVGLIVLEFGVNVGAAEAKSYSYYQRMLTGQLRLLRRTVPEIPVLVIGISDMSRRRDGAWHTRPSVEKVREAQRNAAFATGCAFWDLYGAMGGEDAMPAWVAARPALAQPDYTHFSGPGARIVGELLWKALIREYDNWARPM